MRISIKKRQIDALHILWFDNKNDSNCSLISFYFGVGNTRSVCIVDLTHLTKLLIESVV